MYESAAVNLDSCDVFRSIQDPTAPQFPSAAAARRPLPPPPPSATPDGWSSFHSSSSWSRRCWPCSKSTEGLISAHDNQFDHRRKGNNLYIIKFLRQITVFYLVQNLRIVLSKGQWVSKVIYGLLNWRRPLFAFEIVWPLVKTTKNLHDLWSQKIWNLNLRSTILFKINKITLNAIFFNGISGEQL